MSRGVYTVVLELSSRRSIRVGRLGILTFDRGFYGYTGSAMGRGGFSLEGRISRYLRRSIRKPFWHIDYLLLESRVEAVVYAESDRSCEHMVAYTLSRNAKPIVGFGSSDCRYGCRSHLHYLGLDPLLALDTIISVYRGLNLKPRVICEERFLNQRRLR
jgi:Uri superfamily endonuclease